MHLHDMRHLHITAILLYSMTSPICHSICHSIAINVCHINNSLACMQLTCSIT